MAAVWLRRLWIAVGLMLALHGDVLNAAEVQGHAKPSVLVQRWMGPQSQTREACEALRNLRLDDTTIEASNMVEVGSFNVPGSTTPIRNLPKFCRVIAVTRPAIRFEVWLPLEKWTERFEVVGNGGMAGTIP